MSVDDKNNRWIASFDFAGLYPNQMKSYSINPFKHINRKNKIKKIFNI